MTDTPASTAPAAAGHPLVKGRCPACNGASLFLGTGGHVTCARLTCPNPTLADDMLHQGRPEPGRWLLEGTRDRSIPQFTARLVSAEEEHAATERARRLAAEAEHAAAHLATIGAPHGLVIEPYRNDRGENVWVFRCWGTDTCDGWLSLDHGSQQSAERARDRHVAEEHQKEQSMSTCTATIEGPHVVGGGPITCTREAGHPENHVGPQQNGEGKVLWSDHNAGAVPHGAATEEESGA